MALGTVAVGVDVEQRRSDVIVEQSGSLQSSVAAQGDVDTAVHVEQPLCSTD